MPTYTQHSTPSKARLYRKNRWASPYLERFVTGSFMTMHSVISPNLLKCSRNPSEKVRQQKRLEAKAGASVFIWHLNKTGKKVHRDRQTDTERGLNCSDNSAIFIMECQQ